MSQLDGITAFKKFETADETRQGWLQLGLLVAVIGLLYYRVLISLARDWWTDPNYSHGLVVPIFCGWVIWRERNRFANAAEKPSRLGLLVILAAVALLVLGVFGAEIFLSRVSFLFLLAGLVIEFRGWRYFRILLFPWIVLFLVIPLPVIILNQAAFPLQFQASRLATAMLGLAGVPVLREGNIIKLSSFTLDVVQACSGLRSLVALIALGVIYGYLSERSAWRRILLVFAAIPIAVIANGVRIMGSGILGEYWDPEKAEGFFHAFSGMFIFLLAFSMLIVFHAVLAWLGRHTYERRV